MREEKFKQFDLVEGFFKRFRNPDGSFLRSFTPYGTPTEFKERLRNDIKQVLKQRLLSGRLGTYSLSQPMRRPLGVPRPIPACAPSRVRRHRFFLVGGAR